MLTALVVTALVLTCACAQHRKAQSGSSESHFLGLCEGACGDGLTCSCEVCTEACDDDDVCRGLAAQSTCMPAASACPGAPAQCDVECVSDRECGALGDGYACTAGRCRGGASSAPVAEVDAATVDAADDSGSGSAPDAGTACVRDATEALRAFAQASKACDADDQCTFADESCYAEESCVGGAAVARGYDVETWGRLHDELAACLAPDDCTTCPVDLEPPRCFAGRCDLVSQALLRLSCEELTAEANRRVQQAVAEADTRCDGDTDCDGVSIDTGCSFGCGAVASHAGVESIQQAVAVLESGLCLGFAQDGCQAFPPSCPFPGTIACVQGRCTTSLATAP